MRNKEINIFLSSGGMKAGRNGKEVIGIEQLEGVISSLGLDGNDIVYIKQIPPLDVSFVYKMMNDFCRKLEENRVLTASFERLPVDNIAPVYHTILGEQSTLKEERFVVSYYPADSN